MNQAFHPDPEQQGFNDAVRGIVANPYGLPDKRVKWDRGHDRACRELEGLKPRFGKFAGRRK